MLGIGIGLGPGVAVSGGGGCTPQFEDAGAVSAGVTFTHPANGVIAWTQTTLGSPVSDVLVRYQDANNHWRVRVWADGTLYLYEDVAGVVTARATTGAGVVSNGHRIVVVCDGTTIEIYSNDVLRITYSSASNFATATDGRLDALGTGGAVSDLRTWSLACRASEGV